MADLTKTIEIIFGGKDEITQTFRGIESGLDSFTNKMGSATQPIADLTDSVVKVDAALIALAIGGMALAIKESSDFNSSFALISTSITASGEDLEKFRNDVLNYSTTSVKSIEDINSSLYTAAQAGVQYGDSLAFIAKAEELAVANKANLNTTVDLLTGTMNAYGFTVKDLGHINDVFFTSTLIGKQTIDELGGSMGNVVGIAANSGVSFEDLSAAIATLTAKGLGTEEAITAVKGVITAIISPSKQAADAAAALGLNFSLTELSSKGFAAMLAEIMTKTGGSAEEMVKLFSEVRAMNGVLGLTGDSMTFFNQALDRIINSAGNTEEAYKKMVATFESQSQMLINSAKAVLVSVGTEIEPIALGISTAFGDIFKGIKAGIDSGAFDPLFEYLKKVGGDIALFFQGVAKALPGALENIDFTPLLDSFDNLGKALGTAFKAFFGNLDLTTPEGLAEALNKVIKAFATLNEVVAGIIKSFGPALEALGDFVDNFINAEASTKDFIGTLMGIGTQINMVADNIGDFVNVMYLLTGVTFVNAGISAYNFMSQLTLLSGTMSVLGASVTSLSQLLGGGGLAFAIGYGVGEIVRLIPGVDTAAQSFAAWTDKIFNWTGTQGKANEMTAEMAERVRIGNERLAAMRETVNTLPAAKATSVTVENVEKASAAVTDFKARIDTVPEKRTVGVEVLADGTSIETTKDIIIKTFPDGSTLITNVGLKTDAANLADTKKKVDDAVPASKVMEIQASIDIAKIKAASDIVQSSIEWTAKVDIAQIEASTKIVESMFDSINNTITSTGETLSSMIGSIADMNSSSQSWEILDLAKEEMQLRKDAIDLQKKLTEAEIALINQQAEKMKAGGAMIEIDGKGLQPHLEAFMFEILSAIQVKANAEGMKFLVGTT